MTNAVDDIKQRLDIVAFIGEYVPLKRAGQNYSGLCCFHSENHPSLIVFPETQTWRCFGSCGIGGDIFTFIQKRENLDFSAALKLLADKAGIQLTDQATPSTDRTRLHALITAAVDFYHAQLQPPLGTTALRYARSRGLTNETLRGFKLGFAADTWDGLRQHLQGHGYTEEEMLAAGIAKKGNRGIYDVFRGRLMFPILDAVGKPVGFGGRALTPEAQPKYLNSPQSALFDKGALLYGLHAAREAIKASGTAVLVEGYMDAVTAHQAGFTNTLAGMGTSLTITQAKTLARYGKRIVLALDGDKPGQAAAQRALHTISKLPDSGLDLRVLVLPDSLDPDNVIREQPEHWPELVEQARGAADYIIDVGTSALAADAGAAEREMVARQLLPILLSTESDLARGYNIQLLATRLKLREQTLLDWASGQKPRETPPPNMERGIGGDVKRLSQESNFLAMILRHNEWMSFVHLALLELDLPSFNAADLVQPDHRALYEHMAAARDQDEVKFAKYLEAHLDERLRSLYAELLGCYQAESYEIAVEYGLRQRRSRLERENRELITLEEQTDLFLENAQAIRSLAAKLRESLTR